MLLYSVTRCTLRLTHMMFFSMMFFTLWSNYYIIPSFCILPKESWEWAGDLLSDDVCRCLKPDHQCPTLSSSLSPEKPADSTNIPGLGPGPEETRSWTSNMRVSSLKESGSEGKRGRWLVREDGLRKVEESCRCFRVWGSKSRAKEKEPVSGKAVDAVVMS